MSKENSLLKQRVEVLESQVAVGRNTTNKLKIEVDRLDQYQRRSNIILKNVEVQPQNSPDGDAKFVQQLFEKNLKLPNAFPDVDKLHRTGKVREMNGGKKAQDIIVRFKSHRVRYEVYKERKKSNNVKIRPNLTRKRGDLLYRASQLVNGIEEIDFCFANTHGDLTLRLKEASNNGKQFFNFHSMDDLRTILRQQSIDFMDNEDADDINEDE